MNATLAIPNEMAFSVNYVIIIRFGLRAALNSERRRRPKKQEARQKITLRKRP